jgi:DNA-binding IscR family transcriptional regulator
MNPIPMSFAGPIERRPIVTSRLTEGRNIKSAMGRVLNDTQQALEQRLSRISLAQVVADLRKNDLTGSSQAQRPW